MSTNTDPDRHMGDFSALTLHSARLLLRPLTAGDAAALFAIFADPQAMRYWSGPPWTDPAQADAMVARSAHQLREGSALRLGLQTEDGRLIGMCNLHAFFKSNKRCEMGYILGSRDWGCGYMQEALTVLIEHAMTTLGLNRIEADIDPRNAASAKLLQRLAFRKEGYLPERWIVDGVVCDTEYYGLLRSYWLARV
ncbi:MAG: GNAT family N-acetyltransferase [Pseudomonadota bacterium]